MAASKSTPRDAQVMAAIMKDMGVSEYEPRVINQMLEFAYSASIYLSVVLMHSSKYINPLLSPNGINLRSHHTNSYAHIIKTQQFIVILIPINLDYVIISCLKKT